MRILLLPYDNGMHINYPPLNLMYVASALIQEGHNVQVYQHDIYHSEDSLRQHLRNNDYDIIGLGACAGYYQYQQIQKLCQIIRVESTARIWLGGHLVSPDPFYFQEKMGVDRVYCGEYDFIEDLDSLSFPARGLFNIDYYALMRLPHADNSDRCFPVLGGRGCPFACTFCYRMHSGYRAHSIERILEEVSILIEDYHITYIDFADELLMTNPDRPVQIAEAMKPLGIKWDCNGRLNYAKPEILKKMKESGCVFINYGIESVDDEVLELMNKKLRYDQIIKGVEATLEAGISPGLNIIWGNLGDTKDTLWRSVEFLLEYDDHAQLRTIRPVTPYPGSPLYDYAIEKGLLKDIGDFYEKHKNSDLLTVNFTGLSDEDFYYELCQANLALLKRYFGIQHASFISQAWKLYYHGDTGFRGFRQT